MGEKMLSLKEAFVDRGNELPLHYLEYYLSLQTRHYLYKEKKVQSNECTFEMDTQ